MNWYCIHHASQRAYCFPTFRASSYFHPNLLWAHLLWLPRQRLPSGAMGTERTIEAFSPWGVLAAQLSHMSSKGISKRLIRRADLPQSLCPALNPKNTPAAAARLFDYYTTALARLAEFRRGSMRNQMQVFPKYPHILEKHKLGDGQLNSTLIWAAWLFSTKMCRA